MNAKLALIATVVSSTYWASRNDDHPTTFYYKAFRVEAMVEGRIKWGPFKTRPNVKREHWGISTVRIVHTKEFVSEEETWKRDAKADAASREAAEKFLDELRECLMTKGYTVERDDTQTLDARDGWLWYPVITWLLDPPPERFRRMSAERIKLEDIELMT
jgi:hypothetical protein